MEQNQIKFKRSHIGTNNKLWKQLCQVAEQEMFSKGQSTQPETFRIADEDKLWSQKIRFQAFFVLFSLGKLSFF